MNKPKELRYLLTQKCNYDCVFCNHEGLDTKTPAKLTADDLVYLFTVCRDNFGWHNLSLTGGEPLTYKDFDALVTDIAALQGKITLISNGALLDKHLDTVGLLERVNLSLHTLDADKYHRLVRGHSDLRKVISNIDAVHERAPQTDIRLNVVLNRGFNDSPADVKRLLDFAQQHNCSLKFLELANDRDHIVPLDTIIRLLQQNGAEYQTNFENKKILLKNGATDIILTRTTCEHAKLQADPAQACRDNFDYFITPSGTVNRCVITNQQTSLLTEIKNRDDEMLVAKLTTIGQHFGAHCCHWSRVNAEKTK